MSRRLVMRPRAEADIHEAALWYQDKITGLDDAFLLEVDAALRRAAENPHAFLRLRRRPDVRRVLVRRFPYRVFYILRPDAVIVFRVLHGARHDREWKKQV